MYALEDGSGMPGRWRGDQPCAGSMGKLRGSTQERWGLGEQSPWPKEKSSHHGLRKRNGTTSHPIRTETPPSKVLSVKVWDSCQGSA